MSGAPRVDLAPLWLPLLRSLTEASPEWGLWKNVDGAIRGSGDIDSTAPRELWAMLEERFTDWALSSGFGPVVACRHVRGVLFLVAIDQRERRVHELDVNARKYFRGWTMFRPRDLLPVMELDERGFRRVRPGAEGLIQLVQNGMKWGGRPDPAGLIAKGVVPKLRGDPAGVHAGSSIFGWARGAAVDVARSVMEGGWDRRAALTVEARALLGAVQEPSIALSRVWARRIKKRCPVLRMIFHENRRVPDDLTAWTSVVAASHHVDGGTG